MALSAYKVNKLINQIAGTKSLDEAKKCLRGLKLSKIGEGSSRAVYALNDKVVLKLAMNVKGIAQNKVETKIGTMPGVAQIKYYCPNGHALVVERCKRLNNEQMNVLDCIDRLDKKKMMGKNGIEYLKNELCDWSTTMKKAEKLAKKYGESMKAMASTIHKKHLTDFYYDQFGVNKKGQIVMVDYGLDEKTWEKYYQNCPW